MESWHSYPSIYNLGHKALQELFKEPVLVEEKVDGSQFSFGLFQDAEGVRYIRCRSKGAQLNLVAPEGMFIKAIDSVRQIEAKLNVGWTYRAEYLCKPKHNSLTYDRVPAGNLIIFDINTGEEAYVSYEDKKAESERLGLEIVPSIYQGLVENVEIFRSFLDRESCLGGQKIEGVVIKNYTRFGPDKKVLMGKFVSEAFKEIHSREWKTSNPTQGDIIQQIIDEYRTPARWSKAVQHLREAGKIEDSPRDIGLLMKEVPSDIKKECAEEIAAYLTAHAMPQIMRGVVGGLPEWWKEELLKEQFSDR